MKNKKNIFSNRKILIIILFIALLVIIMVATRKRKTASFGEEIGEDPVKAIVASFGEEFTINGKGKAIVGGKLNLEIEDVYVRRVALDFDRGYGGDSAVVHIRLKEGKKTVTIVLSPPQSSDIWEGYRIEVIDIKFSSSMTITTLKVDIA